MGYSITPSNDRFKEVQGQRQSYASKLAAKIHASPTPSLLNDSLAKELYAEKKTLYADYTRTIREPPDSIGHQKDPWARLAPGALQLTRKAVRAYAQSRRWPWDPTGGLLLTPLAQNRHFQVSSGSQVATFVDPSR